MNKLQKLLLLLFLLAALIPAWWLNRYLQRVIQPRKSLGRLLLYILCGFAMVFGYTLLLALLVFNLFPLPKR